MERIRLVSLLNIVNGFDRTYVHSGPQISIVFNEKTNVSSECFEQNTTLQLIRLTRRVFNWVSIHLNILECEGHITTNGILQLICLSRRVFNWVSKHLNVLECEGHFYHYQRCTAAHFSNHRANHFVVENLNWYMYTLLEVLCWESKFLYRHSTYLLHRVRKQNSCMFIVHTCYIVSPCEVIFWQHTGLK